MKIVKLMNTLLGGALLLCAVSAQADTVYNIGILDDAPYSLSNPYVNNASVTGSFLDTYAFSLNNISNVGASVSQLTLSLGAFNVLDISNLGLNLFEVGTGWLAGVNGPGQINSLLNNGDYYVRVAGVTTGLAGGNYTFSAVAQPVPEPEGWALVLSGLAVTGFMAFRRRNVL